LLPFGLQMFLYYLELVFDSGKSVKYLLEYSYAFVISLNILA